MEKPLNSNPLTPHKSRENELIGGIKNALERGQPLEKAKKSFLNAGYKKEEVESASKKINTAEITPLSHPKKTTQKIAKPKKGFFSRIFKRKNKTLPQNSQQAQKQNTKQVTPPQTSPPPQTKPIQPKTPQKLPQSNQQQKTQNQPKQISRVWIIIMIIISALILISSAILGLYWETLF